MIGLATKQDINQLKYIWKICFNDDDKYIDYYFSNFFDKNNVFVYRENSIPVGMITMIKTKFNLKDKQQDAIYLYAVATLPDYQGQAIMRKLEQAVCDYAIQNNIYICVLVPQSESLFNLYFKIGYQEFFYLSNKKYINCKKENVALNITDCSFNDFEFLRNNYLNNFDVNISHYNNTLNYIYKDLKNNGCDIIKIDFENHNGYLIYFKKNNDLYLIETTFEHDLIDKIIPSLINRYNAENCFVRTYDNAAQDYETKPFGMIKFLKQQYYKYKLDIKPYMNLMLD